MKKFIRKFLSSRYFLIFIFFALLFPELFSAFPQTDYGQYPISHFTWYGSIGLPRVFSGDEPHYLLMVNSLIKDGDFDLKNNYQSVHEGSEEAGKGFAHSGVDHHSGWFLNGRFSQWTDWAENHGTVWYRNEQGKPYFKYKEGAPVNLASLPELFWHPPMLAILISPFVYFFRNTEFVEPLVIFISAVVTFIGFLLFKSLMSVFIKDKILINIVSGITFLCTPLWHYSRTFFAEPYITFFVIASWSLALRYKHERVRGKLIPGLSMGFAIGISPPSALMFAPLILNDFLLNKFKYFFYFLIGPVLGMASILWINDFITGNPLKSWRPVPIAPIPFQNLYNVLFSIEHGLFFFAPVLSLGILGWYQLIRGGNRHALMALVGGFSSILFFSSLVNWDPGYCFGPRYLVPCIPLLMIGISPALEVVNKRGRRSFSFATLALILLSFTINFLGVFPYFRYWSKNPLLSILG